METSYLPTATDFIKAMVRQKGEFTPLTESEDEKATEILRLVGYYADKTEIITHLDDLIFAVNQLPAQGPEVASRFRGATEALQEVVRMNTNTALYLSRLQELAYAADLFDDEEQRRLRERREEATPRPASTFDAAGYMERAEERAAQRDELISRLEKKMTTDEAQPDATPAPASLAN